MEQISAEGKVSELRCWEREQTLLWTSFNGTEATWWLFSQEIPQRGRDHAEAAAAPAAASAPGAASRAGPLAHGEQVSWGSGTGSTGGALQPCRKTWGAPQRGTGFGNGKRWGGDAAWLHSSSHREMGQSSGCSVSCSQVRERLECVSRGGLHSHPSCQLSAALPAEPFPHGAGWCSVSVMTALQAPAVQRAPLRWVLCGRGSAA